jgi:putative heme-binding domain-containing protein
MIYWAILLLLQLPQVLDLAVPEKNPYTSQADLALGKKLFAARCAGCHGPGGDGGKGANLAVSILPRSSDDRGLYRTIRYGLPETEMPGSNMAPSEIWQVAAFVRTLGRVQSETPLGDARKGGELVRGKAACLQCHALGIDGGRLGPQLTGIGQRRSSAYLREKILDSSKAVPDQFRLVELKTKTGQTISGIWLNEDIFSIQIRDQNDNLHSFWKEDLLEMKQDRRTLMPSYQGRLNAQELDDVIAYLAGLKGGQ